jgi:hypothetical protein
MRGACKISAVVALAISGALSARAAVLDQSQEQDSGSARLLQRYRYAQTFTAGMSGPLDSVWVDSALVNDHETPYVDSISILGTSGGVPSGAPLATVTADIPINFGWVPLSFAATGLQLHAGQTYAVVLTNDDTSTGPYPYGDEVSVLWGGDKYPGGTLLESDSGGAWSPFENEFNEPLSGADLKFRTYIVPEPASFTALAAAGSASLLLRRRRTR